MILKYGGIHKRVVFLIEKSGGYNITYHINKVAKIYNVKKEFVKYIFEYVNLKDREFYTSLIADGYPIEDIVEDIKLKRNKDRANFEAMMNVCSRVISKANMKNFI